MQLYVLFDNHHKCRDMKIKKSGILRRRAPNGNNKIIAFRRCSKTNTSDRIKKDSGRLSKKAFEDEKPQQQNLSKAQVDARKSLIQIVWHKQ